MIHSSKTRLSSEDPFGIIIFDLSNTIMSIERVYPTFVDMVSDFGGVVEVIFFLAGCTMALHHSVVMDQVLLNDAILYKDKEEQRRDFEKSKIGLSKVAGAQNQRHETCSFSYWEIA